MIRYSEVDSPIGSLLLTSDGRAVTGLHLRGRHPEAAWRRDDDWFADAREQLAEYFAGTRTTFDLPLVASGTAFQRRVWDALLTIPYGQTISYGDLARRVGQPRAAQAVGAANGANPIAILIPCHRVVGADGSLTGYGGGLDRKRALLRLEAEHTGLFAPAGAPPTDHGHSSSTRA